MAHSQRQLKPVDRDPGAHPAKSDFGEVRMAAEQTLNETRPQVADYETGHLDDRHWLLAALPVIFVLGGFGLLAYFAGLIVTLVVVGVVLIVLVRWGIWVLDNTIEL